MAAIAGQMSRLFGPIGGAVPRNVLAATDAEEIQGGLRR